MSDDKVEAHYKLVMSTASSAIRMAFGLNGAAALALLTFIGHAPTNVDIVKLAWALKFFGIGALFAATATGMSFLAQLKYLREIRVHGDIRRNNIATKASIGLVIASLIVAIAALWIAGNAFCVAAVQ